MSIKKVSVNVDNSDYDLLWNDKNGSYESIITAPYEASGNGHYPVRLDATDEAGNKTTVTESDENFGEDLKLLVREKKPISIEDLEVPFTDYYVYDSDFMPKKVLDSYISAIWTVRYNEYGDFEICAPYTKEVFDSIKMDDYIGRLDSDRLMCVENIQIDTDVDSGDTIIFSGRSVESILDRRVIFSQTVLDGKFQDGIETLLNENAIAPEDELRKLPIIFKKSEDPYISELEIAIQFSGETLYEAIEGLCAENKVGFRMLPDPESKAFSFELYRGVDRSYEQSDLPYVIFSPEFDNIVTSKYLSSKKDFKNVAFAAGEGDGSDRRVVEVYSEEDAPSGLDRREMYVDAGTVSSTTSDGQIQDEEYLSQLAAAGTDELAKSSSTTYFEGEVDSSRQFVFGVDFGIGDIVQLRNEYGIEGRARVTEMVMSIDQNGVVSVPTFVSIEKEEK